MSKEYEKVFLWVTLQYMRPTTDFLVERFGEFNQTFFGGTLPPIPILLSDVKSYAGMYVHRRRTSGVTRQIKINIRMDLPREEYEDTLLHEMIHYAIDLSGKRDNAPHGTLFRQMMQMINENGDRHISNSHSLPRGSTDHIDRRPRWHIVAVLTTAQGPMVKVLPRIAHRIRHYYDAVIKSPEVSEIRFFMTRNPYFNRFPVSGTFTAHMIDGEELNRELLDATPLRDGLGLRR